MKTVRLTLLFPTRTYLFIGTSGPENVDFFYRYRNNSLVIWPSRSLITICRTHQGCRLTSIRPFNFFFFFFQQPRKLFIDEVITRIAESKDFRSAHLSDESVPSLANYAYRTFDKLFFIYLNYFIPKVRAVKSLWCDGSCVIDCSRPDTSRSVIRKEARSRKNQPSSRTIRSRGEVRARARARGATEPVQRHF